MSLDYKIKMKRRFVNKLHNTMTAWVILIASLTLTIAAYIISNSVIHEKARDRFEFRASEIKQAIEERLHLYEQVLWSGVSTIYASDDITRAKWAKFVETLNIERYWPGIQGIGFSIPITSENKEAHVQALRSEGFPEYTIKPEGEREFYSAIIYLEPFDWRNQRAFGYDMWSNDIRQVAMKRALETGEAATSGIITLVQETSKDIQKGFLIYVPVYKTKNVPKTVEQRKAQFVGWVYAPFRAGNLMKGILGTEDPDIDFEIYDGKEFSNEALLFDSNGRPHLEETEHDPQFEQRTQITLQGRPWTLYFSTPDKFSVGMTANIPRFVAIVGAIIDLLLFYLILSLHFLNKKTESLVQARTIGLEQAKSDLEALVNERTKELQTAKENLEDQVNQRTKDLKYKIAELEFLNDATMGREGRIIELKREVNELSKALGRPVPYEGTDT